MIPVSRDSAYASISEDCRTKSERLLEKLRTREEETPTSKYSQGVKNDFQLPTGEENHGIVESQLTQPVENMPLDDFVVAGVDGGVLNKSLHGLDLILLRSVVAMFSYDKSELQDVSYHPSEMPVPRLINIHEPMDSRELDTLVGLHRQMSEIDRAREIVEDEDIDALLLDGSVVPQYVNHSSKDQTKNLYKRLIVPTRIYIRSVQIREYFWQEQ